MVLKTPCGVAKDELCLCVEEAARCEECNVLWIEHCDQHVQAHFEEHSERLSVQTDGRRTCSCSSDLRFVVLVEFAEDRYGLICSFSIMERSYAPLC